MNVKIATMFIGILTMTAFLLAGCASTYQGKNKSPPGADQSDEVRCPSSWQDDDGEDGGPKDLVARSADEGRIILNWSPPDGPQPAKYIIFGTEWDGEEGDIEFVERGSTTVPSADFGGLTIGQLYLFQIAIEHAGDMKRSNVSAAWSCEHVD